jgi:retron-type reverse transcriptase
MTTEVAAGPVEIAALTSGRCEQNVRKSGDEATNVTAGKETLHDEHRDLLLVVLDRQNMQKAYSRVMRNKGAAGVDGMKIGELKADLQSHWPEYKAALLL